MTISHISGACLSQILGQGPTTGCGSTAADVVRPYRTNEGKTMIRGSARVQQDLEVGIREVVGRIISSTTDVADLGDVDPRNERLRHELAHDVLADACV